MTETMKDWMERQKNKRITDGRGNRFNHRGFDDGRASAIQTKRWEDSRNAATEGMIDGVNQYLEEKAEKEQKEISDIVSINRSKTPVDALKQIASHATVVYMRTNTPKGLADLGNFIMKITGSIKQPDDRSVKDDGLPMPALDEAYNIVNFFIMQDPEKNSKLKEYVDAQSRDAK